jgi:insulysin
MLKSPNDKSEYQTYKLNNGLRVFLIYDTEIQESAVAMHVNIGSYQDKNFGIDGLAHLLEHMLFNGTKKYPKENEFSEFVSKNGGHTNAYTSGSHTCYHYVISNMKILDSLEMFGDFFVNPTLDENSVEREKEAVNSEHEKNFNDDLWIESYLFRISCDKENPYNGFSTGNKETLSIPDIGKKIKEIYDSFYSAHLMTLAIATRENLENVKNVVDNIFSQIKSHLTPNTIIDIPYFTKSKIVKYVPVKEKEKISFNWNIPSFRNSPKENPNSFISHLLGNEAENTIHHILYDQGYIKELVSSYTHDYSYSIFSISIELTEIGMQNIDKITNTIYSYIELLIKNINNPVLKTLYDEQQNLKKYNNVFFQKPSSLKRVMYLCNKYNSVNVELNELLVINSLSNEFDDKVKDNMLLVLNEMKPEKCIVIMCSKKFANQNNQSAKYYNSEYSANNGILNHNVNINIPMPETNPYLSTGTEIFDLQILNEPQLISDNKIIGFWYPDISFQNPDVSIILDILFPNITREPKKLISASLYLNTVLQCGNKIIYLMGSAGFDIHILNKIIPNNTLGIVIYGNYKKIKNIYGEIINIILNQELDENIFNIQKEKNKINSFNTIYESPYKRIGVLLEEVLCETHIKREVFLDIIDTITFQDIINIKNEIFSSGECTILISGNIQKECANEIIDMTSNLIKEHCLNINLEYKIPDSKNFIFTKKVENERDNNSVIANFLHLSSYDKNKENKENFVNYEKYLENFAITNIIDAIMSSDYFDTLRTKECYGYIVDSGLSILKTKDTYHLYYKFLVQSAEKKCNNMIERINRYIDEYYNKLKQISEDVINEISLSIIEQLIAPYSSLSEKSNYYMICINDNKFIHKNKILVEKIKKIKLYDIIKFYEDKFMNRKSLIVGFESF